MQCDWGMVIAIVGTNLALAAIISGFIIWAFSKLDSDIKSLSNKIDTDMKAQTARTDRLYEMFIDLLKEQKGPKTNP